MKACLIKEADTLIRLAGVTEITSVFFGGGTPSLAKPETVKALLESVKSLVSIKNNAEISLEVNPTFLEIETLREFSDAGINRVSIGVQTLNKNGLQILGRDHSEEESLKCLEMSKSLFPGQVSMDLIFGWPSQTLDMWISELNQILPICDNHLSLYQLTVERGTHLFKQIQQGHLRQQDSQVVEDMYLTAVDLLERNSFERYEISNFAREKCYSHHNKAYWTGHDYIGIGPGAHGRFQPVASKQRQARIQTLEPNDWMWEVERFGHATRKATSLSQLQQLEELLIVGLRTREGISNKVWMKISEERSIQELLQGPEVKQLVQRDLLMFDGEDLRATKEGQNIIDSLLPDLINVLGQNQRLAASMTTQPQNLT
ncbi:radical S-adenosyl methionine domain-containing protein 1, mitochondrial-like isoform X2 [Physella acuta]|nr:radical S-adenosyl methionine domain-containing protein 1, mitochondrial-like isoform X2 [Physella acuta]